MYRLEYNFSRYIEETIYEKTKENLLGQALSVSGSYARIHDQLSLPKAGASLDEILLQRKELETDYGYHISLGFNCTFGQVYRTWSTLASATDLETHSSDC